MPPPRTSDSTLNAKRIGNFRPGNFQWPSKKCRHICNARYSQPYFRNIYRRCQLAIIHFLYRRLFIGRNFGSPPEKNPTYAPGAAHLKWIIQPSIRPAKSRTRKFEVADIRWEDKDNISKNCIAGCSENWHVNGTRLSARRVKGKCDGDMAMR